MATTKTETIVVIDPEATYLVSVARPFHARGVSFSPMDVEVHLSGVLVTEFKDCLSSYTKMES
jgi:hypothetical protein